jgi:hypothetical protein
MSVPNGTKFIGISANVDTLERKSALANSPSQIYTIEDIADSVSGAEWGDITGTLSEQGDLQTALDEKLNEDFSSLTSAGPLDGTEVVPIVQDGATVKVTTQDIADLGGGGGGGNRLATHILAKPRSLFYYSTALTANNLQANTQIPNVLMPTAFTPAYDLTINTFIIEVTGAAVGGLAKIAIYSDLDGVPHTKLLESVDVSTDTTGIKTITGFTFTFTAGVTYWIATVTNSSTALFRIMSSSALMLAPVIATSISTQVYTSWFINVTYASLPSTLTTPTTSDLNHSSIAYIRFRAV